MMNSKGKDAALAAVEKEAKTFCDLSDRIWEFAELSLKEVKSAALYRETLAALGFVVEDQVAGLATAFLGKYGEGHPVIGILGEFDALSGLS